MHAVLPWRQLRLRHLTPTPPPPQLNAKLPSW